MYADVLIQSRLLSLVTLKGLKAGLADGNDIGNTAHHDYAASRFSAGRDGGKMFQKMQNQTTIKITTTAPDNLLQH